MSFGLLTDSMRTVVQILVHQKTVWDLGAGDLQLAQTLLTLGAARVIAVDKGKMPRSAGVTRIQMCFDRIQVPEEGIDVAFVSWPEGRVIPGLVDLLAKARTVIYLGSNVQGDSCGGRDLWDHFQFREVLVYVPHRRNSLIVLGKTIDYRRPLLGEEVGANGGLMVSFETAEEVAAQVAATLAATREP